MGDPESDGAGFVTEFDVPEEYIKMYPIQTVGLNHHKELWVPAEELEVFNDNILNGIQISKAFIGRKFIMTTKISSVLN